MCAYDGMSRRTEPWLLGEAGKGFSFSISGLGHFKQKVLYGAPVVGGESHWRLYRYSDPTRS